MTGVIIFISGIEIQDRVFWLHTFDHNLMFDFKKKSVWLFVGFLNSFPDLNIQLGHVLFTACGTHHRPVYARAAGAVSTWLPDWFYFNIIGVVLADILLRKCQAHYGSTYFFLFCLYLGCFNDQTQ